MPKKYNISFGKRLFDLLFSFFALLFFSPLMIIIFIAIKLESKGPALYCQKRVGSGYKIFVLYKFRTMYENSEQQLPKLSQMNAYLKSLREEGEPVSLDECLDCKAQGKPCSPVLHIDGVEICENHYLRLKRGQVLQKVFFKAENDPRVTRVGRFLRQYHLDEIPQFLNVLKGDMSVVGNRPLPMYEAEFLTIDEWSYRFLAPAGITGLWQVRASEIHRPEERIALDNQYALTRGFWTDLRILFKTIITFFRFQKVSY
ncbi:MAG: sugar transferase [Bacteroidales bacterium]|nr:sugar transferase [Bacteroidales bacterium]